ncbi:hypothetical protein E0H46_19110 [Rhizobium leguminosarum bv. viciae]|nr:hypothetical protein E0H46_19110 [Rhizobium leguminosarum bv. viciae]
MRIISSHLSQPKLTRSYKHPRRIIGSRSIRISICDTINSIAIRQGCHC